MRTIDLKGPDGNAFYLMGTARRFAKDLDWTHDQINDMMNDMKSSDYEHLCDVFEKHFSDFATLDRGCDD